MKYFFAAIAFWTLGYVIPSFPVLLQYIIAATVLVFLGASLIYFIDTRIYAEILHEEKEDHLTDNYQ